MLHKKQQKTHPTQTTSRKHCAESLFLNSKNEEEKRYNKEINKEIKR